MSQGKTNAARSPYLIVALSFDAHKELVAVGELGVFADLAVWLEADGSHRVEPDLTRKQTVRVALMHDAGVSLGIANEERVVGDDRLVAWVWIPNPLHIAKPQSAFV
jgi:hypothetical protein